MTGTRGWTRVAPRVFAYLQEHPDQPIHISTIAAALGLQKPQVASPLAAAVKDGSMDGRIERVAHGIYLWRQRPAGTVGLTNGLVPSWSDRWGFPEPEPEPLPVHFPIQVPKPAPVSSRIFEELGRTTSGKTIVRCDDGILYTLEEL
jgi:hypothetical protein